MRQLQETQSPTRPSNITSGQILAAEDGGDEEPHELPDGLFADDVDAVGNGLHHPREDEDDGLNEFSKIPACRRRKTSTSMRPEVTPRTGRGVRPALQDEVLENLTP